MSQIINTISWEQAVKQDQLKEVAEYYQQQLNEVVRFFAKNTLAQLTHMELNLEVWELSRYYMEGDYSKFLFDKTQQYLDKLESEKELIAKMKESFLKVTEANNKLFNIQIDKNDTKD